MADNKGEQLVTVGTKVSKPVKKELEARAIEQSEPGDRRGPSDIQRELIHAYLGIDPSSMYVDEEDIEAVRENGGEEDDADV